jgi:hypothetical protein
MKRVNQIRLYRLGSLTRLRALAPSDADTFWNDTAHASIRLRAFASDDNEKTMPAAVARARELFNELRRIDQEGKGLDETGASRIARLLTEFETSLEDALTRHPTYEVEPVGAYSSDYLITSADHVFPPSLRSDGIIPKNALDDFRSAGQCLAFDVPTACGFHVFRATDSMLRRYCEHFGGSTLKPKIRNWGSYIRLLRKILAHAEHDRKPNIRTVELLDKIREIDRNPVVHPEQDLDSETALAIFDMCKNAILFMALDIKRYP